MKKTIFVLIAALGLTLIGSSQVWALLYGLCGGHVYDSNGVAVGNAWVQGCNHNGVVLTDYSNYTGLYGLNDTIPPPSGWYDYCACKNGVGHDGTSIYHTWGTADSWDPHLSGSGCPCPVCTQQSPGP